jgi:hypothetical protein
MKRKSISLTILLALALFSAACAAPDTTTQEGNSTALPVVSTQDTGGTEATVASTAAAVEATATQNVGETAAPTLAAQDTTPEPGTAGTAVIPQTGPGDAGLPDNLDEAIRVLRTAGATVNIGEVVEVEQVSLPGQTILIDGEEVQVFTFSSAEEVETLSSQLKDDRDPEEEPHFYKLGSMLVRYVGRNPEVRDLLEDVLGAQAAGQ